VYDLYTPWNPHPRTDQQVVDLYQELTGEPKPYTTEGLRKHFVVANKAIFSATGVYFCFKGKGLRKKYGIPTDNAMACAMRETGSGRYAGTVYKPANKPGKQKQKQKISEGDAIDEVEEVKEIMLNEVNAVELILQPPGGLGYVSRFVSKKLVDTFQIDSSEIHYCTEAAFDRWYSCICFGARHTLPKRVYRLKQLPDGYQYTDDGAPPVTIQALIDTYCWSQLMGTSGVSDMLLDDIWQALKNENSIVAKYGSGNICDDDCNEIVRFLDILPQDIEKLWMATETKDPIRKLIVGVLTHGMTTDECDRLSADALRLGRQARLLYDIFVQGPCQKTIEAFIDAANPDVFCAAYHNHRVDDSCHRDIPPSALSKQMIDDSFESLLSPNVHKLEIMGVKGYSVINKTGNSIDLNCLQRQNPQWDWASVQSVNSWIIANPNGPQTREPRPVYFEPDNTDSFGRYPSHPGHEDPEWEPYVVEDGYAKDDWDKAKSLNVPPEAQKIRKDKTTGDVLFDLEDQEWFPPLTFAPDVTQRHGQSWIEYHSFRRLLWTQEGKKIPTVTCRRWRPFNGRPIVRADTFKDAPRRR
jgi:hypothetical protein